MIKIKNLSIILFLSFSLISSTNFETYILLEQIGFSDYSFHPLLFSTKKIEPDRNTINLILNKEHFNTLKSEITETHFKVKKNNRVDLSFHTFAITIYDDDNKKRKLDFNNENSIVLLNRIIKILKKAGIEHGYIKEMEYWVRCIEYQINMTKPIINE